ncbi:dihydropteroate synthase [Hyphobacterium sp. HN65]|uniref:Dihydropteroate synthase n=1 Tax=Hyphobacterium lacteum TaxID=3116575 RepID=A0ABU7LPS9_9PROT|nr:dihydropteroate synthase [Hyphobacterium sp. HN65]MEE2525917.1 dihydropteroate synthase [Hyphobacterium sp. HN65]
MSFPPSQHGRPMVMGIVNVTPDSFSDGGRFADVDAAIDHALKLVREGADILDIGGESTRPGATPVDAATELERVIPVIRGIRRHSDVGISIDTMKPEVAAKAVETGATIWNDVNALKTPGAVELAAKLGCGVILMHMQGDPQTMQQDPVYEDVVREVGTGLSRRAEAVISGGVSREKIWLDPGIGFGKLLQHNLQLLRSISGLSKLGFPLLIGASRKRFIGMIDEDAATSDRLGGSLYAAIHAAQQNAACVRVHDVRETVQAFKVMAAIAAAR